MLQCVHINEIMVYIVFFSGVGAGLCYGPSIVITGTYFQKRRALANGITFSASSMGGFCFPPLLKYCLDYYGLQGTLLIFGGLLFHVTAAGILFRPPEFYESQRKLFLRQHIRRQVKHSGLVTQTADSIPVSAEVVSNTASMDVCVVPQEYYGAVTKLDYDNLGTGGSSMSTSDTTTCANTEVCTSSVTGMDTRSVIKNSPDNTPLQKVPSQWNILKNPLLYIYALTMPISDTNFVNCAIMIHPYATDIGISKFDAVFLVSIMGICSGVSRFIVGLLSDFNIVKKKYIYQAATLANGIVLCLCPIVRQYVYLAIMSGLCGFFSGTAVVLAPVLIAEEFGTANLPVAIGFLYRFVSANSLCVCVCVCACACACACVCNCIRKHVIVLEHYYASQS